MTTGESDTGIRGFFFAPVTANNLAICRVLICGGLLGCFFTYDVAQWANWPLDAWTPVWFVALFGPLPSAERLAVFGVVWKLSLALAALGLFRRLSLGIAALLGAYLLALTGSFVKHNYDIGLPVIVLFVLWIARSTDAISLDEVIARRRGRSPPPPSGEYRWPLSLVQVLLAFAFFTAGMAKLRHAGIAWITTDNLSWLFLAQQYTHDPPLDWAASIARYPLLCRLIAAGTVATEVAYPLALFVARLRPLLVVSAIALQLGIHLFMGINYSAFLLANLVWVDWTALGRAVLRRRGFHSIVDRLAHDT